MISGSEVLTAWPISIAGEAMVMVPSLAMVM